MIRYILTFLPPLCIAALLFIGVAPGVAEAEPKTTSEAPEPSSEEVDTSNEEVDDATFAKSFLGKPFAGALSIEGWTDISGGLVAPPIYVHQYQREDGTFLILTSKETGPANYEVTDALLVPKPRRSATLSIACTKGEDYTLGDLEKHLILCFV